MLGALLGSLGIPMIQMGDESGRSQQGNNNAYCQDSALTWMDWSLLKSGRGKEFCAFVSKLTAARRRYSSLHSDRYLSGKEVAYGIGALSWWDERGQELAPADWENFEGRALCLRRAAAGDNGRMEVTALLLNAGQQPILFHLPGSLSWQMVWDSANPDAESGLLLNTDYLVADRAAVLLAADMD